MINFISGRSIRRAGAVAVALLFLSSCGVSAEQDGADSAACATPGSSSVNGMNLDGYSPPDGIAIVAANTANSPVPDLSATASELVTNLMQQGSLPSLWSATANPSPLPVKLQQISEKYSPKKNAARLENNIGRISKALATSPEGAGLSLFEGIGVARDQLASEQAQNPWIVVIGSGLDDSGPLSTTGGLLEQDPTRVAEQVAAANPGFSLKGTTVVLQSLGYTVDPQTAPTTAQRDLISKLWETTLTYLGAQVITDPLPAADCSVSTDQPVTPTELPEPTVDCQGQTISYRLPGSLLFAGDSSTVRTGVDELLSDAIEILKANPNTAATVIGHTASSNAYTPDELVKLSDDRANAVKVSLINSGVEAGRITAYGVGDTDPEQEDLNPDGTQNEFAAAERRVQLLISGVADCPR